MYNTKYRANLNISLLKLIVTFINHVTASDFYEKCLFPENRTISLFYSQHKSYSKNVMIGNYWNCILEDRITRTTTTKQALKININHCQRNRAFV